MEQRRLVLLVTVFGTGLLAGCQLGGGNTATSNSPSSTGGGTPLPSLGSTNIETVREAVIARVQPAVVQINVTTGQGGGLGSGVIIDQRGDIITNNRVKFIAPQLIQTDRVTNSGRAALGAGVVTVNPILAAQNGLAVDHGVLIASVTSGGPAAQAGLRPGDVIVQMACR